MNQSERIIPSSGGLSNCELSGKRFNISPARMRRPWLVAVADHAVAVDHHSPTDTRRTEVNTTCLDDLGHVPRGHRVAPYRVFGS